ncbi:MULTISPECIES: hypothetical protein [Paraburkholderia]|uniref:Uncharacterized protein n=1 Tax=Paraburkholderia unamae TaxID=219649 RepID=A0ACC6RH28_9BURK
MPNDPSNAKATATASLLAQLQPHTDSWGAQWHGCALASAFQPVLSIPHAIALDYGGATHVLCADFPPEHGPRERPWREPG